MSSSNIKWTDETSTCNKPHYVPVTFFFFVMWKPARFCFQMPQRMQTHEVIPAPNQPPPKSPDHSYGDERQPVPDDGRFDEK